MSPKDGLALGSTLEALGLDGDDLSFWLVPEVQFRFHIRPSRAQVGKSSNRGSVSGFGHTSERETFRE